MNDEMARLTIPEAARHLGLDERAVRLQIARRKLVACRRDGEWLVLLPQRTGSTGVASNGTNEARVERSAPEPAGSPAPPPAGQAPATTAVPDSAPALAAELAMLRGQLVATAPALERLDRLIAAAQERLAAGRAPAATADRQPAQPARRRSITREVLVQRAFVLDEAALVRLDRLLASLDASRRYVISTSAGETAEAATPAALLGVPAAAALPVTSLTASTAGSSATRAVISLRGGRRSSLIAYDVTGDAADVLHAASQLETWIDGITPWYARLAVIDLTWVFAGIGLLAWLTAVVMVNPGVAGGLPLLPEALLTLSAPAAAIGLALMLLAGLGLLAVSMLLNRLKQWLLPAATFAIGQGRRRHRRLITAGSSVLGLGVALSILAVVIHCWLTGVN